eukprot:gene8400-9881_t
MPCLVAPEFLKKSLARRNDITSKDLFTPSQIAISYYLTSLSWDSIGGLMGVFYMLGGIDDVKEKDTFVKTVFYNFMDPEQWEKLSACHSETYIRDTMMDTINKPNQSLVIDRDAVLCYLGKTSDFPGRFYPDRALALGVPKGPMFSKLRNGESVMSSKGEMVHTHQVVDPTLSGTSFLILRCPSTEYFKCLLNHTALEPFFNKTGVMSSIVHIAPKSVIETHLYQQFIDRFGSSTKKDINKFAHFFPNLFPGKPLANVPETLSLSSLSTVAQENIIPCSKVTRVGLGPSSSAGQVEFIDMEDELSDDKDDGVYDTLLSSPIALEFKERLMTEIQAIESIDEKIKYPRILMTGTGSSKPSKQRNVTGHLIETIENQFMLMDCGEGTYGQLARFFGPKRVDEVLLQIKLPKIVVVAPEDLITWLAGLNQSIAIDHIGFKFDSTDTLIDECYKSLGIKSVKSVNVIHCPDARGIVCELASGFKFSFSGDTRPCDSFAEAGCNSHLMIHEATFEDHLQEDAINKNHSTVSEALSVGEKMHADWSLLTHFSQKTKSVNVESSHCNIKFGIAFDFLNISPYQYPLLKSLLDLSNLEATMKQ